MEAIRELIYRARRFIGDVGERGNLGELCDRAEAEMVAAQAQATVTNSAMDVISASEEYEANDESRGVKCISRAFLAGVEWQKRHR